MALNQRSVTIALLLIECGLASAGLIYLASIGVDQSAQRGLLILIPLLIMLTVAAVRGWRWTGPAMVLLSSLITVTLLIDPRSDPRIVPIIFVPMALALVVTTARWTLGTGLVVLAIAVARSGGSGAYTRIDALLVYLFVLICIYVGRLILERAQQEAAAALTAAETARQAAESAAQTAEERATIIQARATDQERLLATVAVLETPAIMVAPDVLLAPIVGVLDARRAEASPSGCSRRLPSAASPRLFWISPGWPPATTSPCSN
jgi:rsbT co-antagonist protein RsbR